MKLAFTTLSTALIAGVLAPGALAQFDSAHNAPPPRPALRQHGSSGTLPALGPTRYRFSVGWGSPTMGVGGIREGDVLVPSAGIILGPVPPPAIDISTADLGLVPVPANCQPQPGVSCRVEVDALSTGEDTQFPAPGAAGAGTLEVHYAVDEWANGFTAAPVFPNVRSEGSATAGFDGSADTFIDLGLPPTPISPPVLPSGTVGSVDGNGFVGLSGALYPGIGLIEPNPPAAGVPDTGDNIDALDVNSPAGFPAGGMYISLDSAFPDPLEGLANTGSAAAQGFVGGDVLNVPGPGLAPVLYAAAATLGLDTLGVDTDDLDALILAENGTPGFQPSLTPHDWVGGTTDMLIFSVRRGSAIIGLLDSISMMPIEEGDLLTPPVGGGVTPGIFIAAEALGLATVRSGEPVIFGDDLCGGDHSDIPVRDCQGVGIEDARRIATGATPDTNMDGVPDSCQGTTPGDDCEVVHFSAGSGDQFGIPFVTGTTGTAGQNEANCYFFATTMIDDDVWFDWMSTADGDATATTCNGTSVDTKIAIWPDNVGCPADGASIACNDDACGLQSSVGWSATTGTSYLIQLGTFPGTSGGSGTFDISVSAPPPCGMYDDGTSGNALGLVAGGETGWMHYFDCFQSIDRVSTAYGTPGAIIPNGNASCIAVYEDADCDGDPTTGPPVLLWSVATVTANVGTDIFDNNPTGGINIPSRCAFIMATAVQIAGEFPAPMDTTNPTVNAWVVGNTPSGAILDKANINNNSVPPLNTGAIGFATAWLLRATGTENGDEPGTKECFGGAGCPCGNDGDGMGGCDNSVAAGGAILGGSGNATIGADTLALEATRSTGQPGIFFQGDISLGSPPTFGDGFRCCGQGVVRVGTYSGGTGTINTDTSPLIGGIGPPISTHPGNAGLTPGDSRCYQWWYRDPTGPCGGSFNLSSAYSVIWN